MSKVSKILTVDWPKYMSYDNLHEKTAEHFSEREGVINKPGSIFYKKRLIDVFLFAMAIGRQEGLRTLLGRKSMTIPTNRLKEEEVWLMCSVALSENKSDLDILTKPDEIIKICEEYANTGIKTMIALDYGYKSDPSEPYEKLMEENIIKFLNKVNP